jgi:uncharacterized membrane protein YccC
MPGLALLQRLNRLIERESLRPDLNRAARGTAAAIVPLVLGHLGHLPVETAYAVLAAQNVAIVDIRGAYSLRFALLLAMTTVLAACAGLGELAAPSLVLALAGMGLVAAGGGLWRHLSTDYGPSLAISSTLVFAVGLAGHGSPDVAGRHVLAAIAGGLWGIALQVGLWPLRPQHPLRRTVAESWLALADLFGAMATDDSAPAPVRHQRVSEAGETLRTTLDQTLLSLKGAAGTRGGKLAGDLTDLTEAADHLAGLVEAFNTAIEAMMEQPEFASVGPAFPPVLTALANSSKTVALAVVSRQPAHLVTFDVRVRRLTNLLTVLRSRGAATPDPTGAYARLNELSERISRHLPVIAAALRATIDRANEQAAFSLELFDLETWRLRSLAAALNLSTRVDPAVARYTLRSAVLTMIGVAGYKLLHLHHGYWLPFTMMVVLQPDYGATRQKAAQRMLGTVGGAVLASAILWLKLPVWAVLAATASTSAAFLYYLKRNYGIAVVFITLFVVLLTETSGVVHLDFAIERLAATLAGGVLAVLAALLFWPVWEQDRFPALLAAALRSNRDYLRRVSADLAAGRPPAVETLQARRAAESANRATFSSLRRMSGDPRNRRETIERDAALANGNQRLTRILNLLTLQLQSGTPPGAGPLLDEFARKGGAALEALAVAAAGPPGAAAEAAALPDLREALDRIRPPAVGDPGDESGRRRVWIDAQVGRAATELSAMLLA